ncbi:carbohydrate ABC transporter membrane protein 2 (CUT1 family) [Alicyclobacillus sacchari]|uniref:Carbohydrate ABC transporter membrane protein 2 (CUT1 family) n=1 Tax=Alicyclobacillus sacchari TaxID=392010 RepID=A0A4R8LTV9_9BACL|nr:carbohydrate ABC transporter permease [Alicyclobacillus sacchari]TDY50197.1 carbohydrate ABC transporter membrane protein 2 (CUT1 family) [Alicyclobacillus sacchari]
MFGRTKTNWVAMIFLSIGSLCILFPIYMAIMVSLKNPQELAQSVLGFPTQIHWGNFQQAMAVTHYFHTFLNSLFITFFAVVLTVLTHSMVAYAIARNMQKRFFRYLYNYFFAAMFVPFPILMLPLVRQMSHLGLADRVGLIILYIIYGISQNVFLYVGYLKSVPLELEEAALVDGANRWRIFWSVVFPLMAPMNATVAILTGLWAWNDFLLPLVMLSNPNQYTLPLVQYAFQSQYSTNYSLAFASYLLALLPMVIVYIFCQKWIVNNVTKGAIK